MKKTLLVITSLTFSLQVFNQSIVNKTTENKNTIIEEFAGIDCAFCPNRHLF